MNERISKITKNGSDRCRFAVKDTSNLKQTELEPISFSLNDLLSHFPEPQGCSKTERDREMAKKKMEETTRDNTEHTRGRERERDGERERQNKYGEKSCEVGRKARKKRYRRPDKGSEVERSEKR